MLVEKQVLIEAPLGRVWQTLMDISFIASCIPGVEDLKTIDANTYRCIAKGKVAYLSATFDLLITVIEKQEPFRLRVLAEGNERHGLARLKQEQILELKETHDGKTEVKYKSELTIVGKLAVLGQKVIIHKFGEMSESFMKPFVARCETSNRSQSNQVQLPISEHGNNPFNI